MEPHFYSNNLPTVGKAVLVRITHIDQIKAIIDCELIEYSNIKGKVVHVETKNRKDSREFNSIKVGQMCILYCEDIISSSDINLSFSSIDDTTRVDLLYKYQCYTKIISLFIKIASYLCKCNERNVEILKKNSTIMNKTNELLDITIRTDNITPNEIISLFFKNQKQLYTVASSWSFCNDIVLAMIKKEFPKKQMSVSILIDILSYNCDANNKINKILYDIYNKLNNVKNDKFKEFISNIKEPSFTSDLKYKYILFGYDLDDNLINIKTEISNIVKSYDQIKISIEYIYNE